ncbi:hypothetical protein PM082_020255 [Marasmius tenuissimus]|nr:hypothetical protein PM082_020255 [Marasmius tenuissimus]
MNVPAIAFQHVSTRSPRNRREHLADVSRALDAVAKKYKSMSLTLKEGWGLVYAVLAYQQGLPNPFVVKVGRTKRELKKRMAELRRSCKGHMQLSVAAWLVPRHIRTGF